MVAILVFIRIFTDLCKVSLPNLKREVSFAIHSESDLNLSKHKDSIESWDGSDTWSSSGDESKSKSIHSSNTMDESADVRSRFTIPEGRLCEFVLVRLKSVMDCSKFRYGGRDPSTTSWCRPNC